MSRVPVDEHGYTSGLSVRGVMQTGSISGYTGHLPGNDQAFGVNFGIQKKMTGGLLTTQRTVDCSSTLRTDMWGNQSTSDPAVKQQLTNLYLRTVDPVAYNDVDMYCGVGKLKDAPVKEEARSANVKLNNPILDINCQPFQPKRPEPAPAQIVGYAGYRPGASENIGKTVNWEETNQD
eukprot:NODE_7717_length_747_cov_122.496795_g7467_i0.p1 GENE.NODE_7717_length_747_cov_122.496795_g7467_i0~~NODE_7717_length_747_cov_122.496795_g7467_i0.p1  ORF type:complete len:204 (-),score=39.40 NODE_7717_length_747_cov_122.496795_g7467_i0:135-668(-)